MNSEFIPGWMWWAVELAQALTGEELRELYRTLHRAESRSYKEHGTMSDLSRELRILRREMMNAITLKRHY